MSCVQHEMRKLCVTYNVYIWMEEKATKKDEKYEQSTEYEEGEKVEGLW